MEIVDTHCHLNFSAYTDPDAVVKRARAAGVSIMVIPGTDVESSKRAVEMAGKGLYVAVGLHPHHLYDSRDYSSDLSQIEELLQNRDVVAVGEIGVDRHEYSESKYGNFQWQESYMKRQKEILSEQIALAHQYEKSLIFHNREAQEDFMDVLKKTPIKVPAVFHCCEASDTLLEYAMNHHIYIGVDGDVTWSKRKQRFIASVPHELLVLETDSPFLMPQPERSEKHYPNEPQYIVHVLSMVAKLWEMPASDVARITTDNAKKLFKLISH